MNEFFSLKTLILSGNFIDGGFPVQGRYLRNVTDVIDFENLFHFVSDICFFWNRTNKSDKFGSARSKTQRIQWPIIRTR